MEQRQLVGRKARPLIGDALALLLVSACGTPVSVPDASPVDAAPPDALCPLPELASFVVSSFVLPSHEIGFDLDGDGTVDNMAGNLPDSPRDSITNGFQDVIDRGDGVFLVLVEGWADPSSPNDPDVTVYFTYALDSDEPFDPSDNHDGNETFLITLKAFDLDCNLRNPSAEGEIVDGVLRARIGSWEFPFVNGSGTLVWVDGWVECQLDSTLKAGTCLLGATWPLCSLASSPLPGYSTGSILDAFINDATMSSMSVDSDRDGDGLEEVIGDGVTVLKCVDGDGTEIQARTCACDPRIADGYSFACQLGLVHANIGGVVP